MYDIFCNSSYSKKLKHVTQHVCWFTLKCLPFLHCNTSSLKGYVKISKQQKHYTRIYITQL